MRTTTLTSKGQITLPKVIRDRFNLKIGDRLDIAVEGQRIVLLPVTLRIVDLAGILPRPERVASIEEMNRSIRRRDHHAK